MIVARCPQREEDFATHQTIALVLIVPVSQFHPGLHSAFSTTVFGQGLAQIGNGIGADKRESISLLLACKDDILSKHSKNVPLKS